MQQQNKINGPTLSLHDMFYHLVYVMIKSKLKKIKGKEREEMLYRKDRLRVEQYVKSERNRQQMI